MANRLDGPVDFISPGMNTRTSPPAARETENASAARSQTGGAPAPAARQVVHNDWKQPPVRSQNHARRKIFFQRAGIERCGHDDNEEIGPALFLNVERARQSDVAIEMPFMKFVKDQRLNSVKRGILNQLAQQDSFGLELDARGSTRRILESNLIADLAPKFHSKLICNARRKQARGKTPGLKNHHLAIAQHPVFEQHLGNLRGLAGSGRRLEHRRRIDFSVATIWFSIS